DHDPRQRATSIGPYTSREMCRALIRRVKELGIAVREGENVVQLLTLGEGREKRACGAVVIRADGTLAAYGAENVVLAVGGPGGLYQTSVYPTVHTGGIGLALLAGARAQSLPESQYGLASTRFRWNVSGTYMQVVPRFVSTDADGVGDAQEFLRPYFDSVGAMNSFVFLKGYQWPFDSRKAVGGSSLVDILVYVETVLKGRRVFLDFRANPDGFAFDDLSAEAYDYLDKSEALLDTPFARLFKMNPGAVELYRDHGIDIEREPLQVAVCAQHNNGGLAANHWWESTNVKHLFPVGEVNGSHGVYRPGGSALNSGQVGGFRAAEYIGSRYQGRKVDREKVDKAARQALEEIAGWVSQCPNAPTTWQAERAEFQARMSRAGAHIRSLDQLSGAVDAAWAQWRRLESQGCAYHTPVELVETGSVDFDRLNPHKLNSQGLIEALRNRQLCFAHAVYLEAIRFALESGVGSRGSAIVLDANGVKIHPRLDESWRIAPEDEAFRDRVQETVATINGTVQNEWVPRRPIPREEAWFETAWARFRSGEVYG
ncbi:MAG: FAD-binding protein, partial [Anaerolineae bacterium]|nr:FAD-binding protein [Anaerolineae bacterium]